MDAPRIHAGEPPRQALPRLRRRVPGHHRRQPHFLAHRLDPQGPRLPRGHRLVGLPAPRGAPPRLTLETRFKPTDEVFFAQNVGNPDAGTGLKKSAIIQKISLKEADAVKNERNATGKVKVTEATSNPQIPNPNGATQWKGQLLYAAEGQGDNKPAALIALNPRAPYNTTGESVPAPGRDVVLTVA